MDTMHEKPMITERWSSTVFALSTSAAAWAIYLAIAALRCIVYGFPNPAWLIGRHTLTAGMAVTLSGLLYIGLRRLERANIGQRFIAALVATAPLAAVLSVFNYNALYVFAPLSYVSELGLDLHPGLLGAVLYSSLENYLVLAGWAVLWTAVSHAVNLQAVSRQAASLEASARAAELRALRLQLDPHFLFNALNTISGLIVSERSAEADRTVEALAAFLRATLEADATADVPLAEELRLQGLYLDIEQIRFGDRLRVTIDVPEVLLDTPVPALILQPIVENSIRHAVAMTSRPVAVTIKAWSVYDRLMLSVQDDGPGDATAGRGLGIGLGNVSGRLRLLYGENAGLSRERLSSGGTRTILNLPAQPMRSRREGERLITCSTR